MSTDPSFADFIVDQLSRAGAVRSRRMFGEYAVYLDDKVVALICDNQLFIKPTKGGKTFIGEVTMAPPYPGAKTSFLIDDRLEDPEWLCELIRITARELPPPKARKKAVPKP